jgi:Uma2 family endonuclease
MAVNEYKPTIIIGEIVAENVSEEAYFASYEGHFEWVDGKVIKMPPITLSHGRIQEYLSDLLKAYFIFKPIGTIQKDPFVMRLKDISNRQPDIQVILHDNMKKIKETYMDGAADICIEIVSTATVSVDRGVKFEEYQKGGVTEYWIIDPQRKEALFYRLDEKVYKPQPIEDDIYITSQLPNFKLHVPTLWEDDMPDMRDILKSVETMLAD